MWYAIQTMTGREQELIDVIDARTDHNTYRRCFYVRREAVWRREGRYIVHVETLFPGYVFVDTEEPEKFYMELKKIPKFSRLLGKELSHNLLSERHGKNPEEKNVYDSIACDPCGCGRTGNRTSEQPEPAGTDFPKTPDKHRGPAHETVQSGRNGHGQQGSAGSGKCSKKEKSGTTGLGNCPVRDRSGTEDCPARGQHEPDGTNDQEEKNPQRNRPGRFGTEDCTVQEQHGLSGTQECLVQAGQHGRQAKETARSGRYGSDCPEARGKLGTQKCTAQDQRGRQAKETTRSGRHGSDCPEARGKLSTQKCTAQDQRGRQAKETARSGRHGSDCPEARGKLGTQKCTAQDQRGHQSGKSSAKNTRRKKIEENILFHAISEEETEFLKCLIGDDPENIVRLSPVELDENSEIINCGGALEHYQDSIIKKRIRLRYVVIRVPFFGRDRDVLLGIRVEKEKILNMLDMD